MQRCDVQQDHPLLLRHTLSGTASDDDLLPALHSRSGGAHCTANPENRATNFRRGTMVWYLSRATGAPCPFSRAGIRLCDYGENGNATLVSATKEKKRQRDRQRRLEQCGQKRKRPLRGCVGRGSDSEDSQGDDERPPPPKVKLTLRLKPLFLKSASPDTSSGSGQTADPATASDSEDSMSVDSSDDESNVPEQKAEEVPWSLPPYPRRSISIPCYTPFFDGAYSSFPSPSGSKDMYRRSPSVSYSIASPPPDSEDEDEDFHITMTGIRRHSAGRVHTPARNDNDNDWDADFDSEGDGETVWESPGPRSPSAPITCEVTVKEEPRDVQGMLDAWEDVDCTVAGAKVAEVIAQAAASGVLDAKSSTNVKTEDFDAWDWESNYYHQTWYSPIEEGLRIKQEDFDLDSLLRGTTLPGSFPGSVPGPSSPVTPITSLSSFPYPDSSSPGSPPRQESDDTDHFATIRSRSRTLPSLTAFLPGPRREPSSSSNSTPESAPPSTPSGTQSLASLIQSMSMSSPTAVAPSSLLLPPPCISPQETRGGTLSSDVVVVHTCQPCTPAVSATQVEGTSYH